MEFPKTHRYIAYVKKYVKDNRIGVCLDPVTAFANCFKGEGNCYIVKFDNRLPSIEDELTTAYQRIETLIAENIKLKQIIKEKKSDRLTSSLLLAMEIRMREVEAMINSVQKVESTEQESCVKRVRFS